MKLESNEYEKITPTCAVHLSTVWAIFSGEDDHQPVWFRRPVLAWGTANKVSRVHINALDVEGSIESQTQIPVGLVSGEFGLRVCEEGDNFIGYFWGAPGEIPGPLWWDGRNQCPRKHETEVDWP